MDRIGELKSFLKKHAPQGIALAFSGGVDSTFLLSVLKELQNEAPYPLAALTMQSVFQDADEHKAVQHTAEEMGVKLHIFPFDPLSLLELKFNPADRCYLCKREFLAKFRDFSNRNGFLHLLDGSNADDGKSYRPGRKALAEAGVISPLAELGFTKREIRQLAAERGLACAALPSRPCLATRFEYGTELTEDLLRRMSEGEKRIRSLVPAGADVRLRVHGKLARIEVSANAEDAVLRERAEILKALHALGFEFITLDLEGFRSGCYDQQFLTQKTVL